MNFASNKEPFSFSANSNLLSISSFPHGRWASMGLIVSCIVALSATMYSMSSCRFAYVDFQSDRGDFSRLHIDEIPDGNPVKYRAGVGLFSWLLPYDEDDWSRGRCVGYTEAQLDFFGDGVLQFSRVFGMISVLGGIVATFWALFLSCRSFTRCQTFSMNLILGGLVCCVGLTFFMFRSQVCQDLLSSHGESAASGCTLDQGGLVAVTAFMFWCVAFSMSLFHIQVLAQDEEILPDTPTTVDLDERDEQRGQLMDERKKRREEQAPPEADDSTSTSRWFLFCGPRGQSVQPSSSPSAQPQIQYVDDDGVQEVELHLPRKSRN